MSILALLCKADDGIGLLYLEFYHFLCLNLNPSLSLNHLFGIMAWIGLSYLSMLTLLHARYCVEKEGLRVRDQRFICSWPGV